MNTRTIIFTLIAVAATFFTSCLDNPEQEERTKAMEQAELEKLLSDLTGKGFDIDTTALGVFYIIHEQGDGPVVTPGDTLTIAYEAFHINGIKFDDSDSWYENGEWEFVYPQTNLIQGFNDGLSLMKKGMVAQFIIPSELAYGVFGYPPVIDAYETIIYGIELKEIKFHNPSN